MGQLSITKYNPTQPSNPTETQLSDLGVELITFTFGPSPGLHF